MKKITAVLLVSSFISACSGSGTGTGSSAPEDHHDPMSGLSLADISGVWDTSERNEQYIDESYLFISQSGITNDYDYRGDSYDNGQNCYSKSTGTIRSLGDNLFETIEADGFRVIFAMSLADNTLTSDVVSINDIPVDDFIEQNNIPVEDFTKTFLSTRSSLYESDFEPLCYGVKQ